jgi:hypothetical protein
MTAIPANARIPSHGGRELDAPRYRANPFAWWKGAVGTAISIDPMLKAADEALKVIK